ncbi:DUF7260 family protein [Halopelagius longus]|uniref:DUF7260 domain-containing protein n=1 Tax=Halopelagius longus TaxID=1236180 RepID=A0A1H0XQY4_9EURY|nr:hypothetical protein [Halopelagius longus]RDI72032.1 hypothetical protein DWB78_10050 [Halopelagius longus]SDQ05358.1 hypothetical protein SAMN05216278_0115 [Halopelagius longus]
MSDALEPPLTARRDARDEHRAVSKQRDAFRRFKDCVETTPAATMDDVGSAGGPAGWTAASSTSGDDACRTVRRAFAELVQPHVTESDDGDPSVHETIAAELTEEVAVALAAEGGGNRFTPQLKRAVLEHTEQRLAENTVMVRVLERERDSLDSAIDDLKAARERLPPTDEATLILADTEELLSMRDRIDAVESDLDAVADRRQETLRHVSATGLKAGIRHDAVVEYLSSDREVTYPVLSAVGELTTRCRKKRDAVHEALREEY